jgi:hypothetical protein
VTAAQAMAFLELPMVPPNAFKARHGLGELVVVPIRQAPSFTSRWRRLAHRFVGLYRATALLLLNVCVVILMLNGILFVYYRAKGDYGDPGHFTGPIDKYGESVIEEVYSGMDKGGLRQLLDETWSRPLAYEAFTEFKERPHSGQWVNVHEAGFRLGKDQKPWPPEPQAMSIFVFGGSTTFGYGVADDQTVPSNLQELLTDRLGIPIAVYNFGRAYYYSTQERLLFEKLLISGYAPKLAIFIDGINEFYFGKHESYFTRHLRQVFDGKAATPVGCLQGLPMARLVGSVSKRLANSTHVEGSPSGAVSELEEPPWDEDEVKLAEVITRYFRNRALIEAGARAFGVRPVLVWQPAPSYKYDLKNHHFGDREPGIYKSSRAGYECMALMGKQTLGENFFWCADMQENARKALYVDQVHYSASFCKELALVICGLLAERRLLPLQP